MGNGNQTQGLIVDLFDLLQQGNFVTGPGGGFLWDCWPNSYCLTLVPDDDYNITIIYDLETLHIHSMEIIAFVDDGTLFGIAKTFRWFDPESKKSYFADSNYVESHDGKHVLTECGHYTGKHILIEDETEMNFVTLKLKYLLGN